MSEHLANDVEKEKDAHLEHVHDANVAIIHQAISAERDEQMGVLKALRIFPRATFWSFMVSFCIVSTDCTKRRDLTSTDHGSL